MPIVTQVFRRSDGLILTETIDSSYGDKQAAALRHETRTVVERMLRDGGLGAAAGADGSARVRVDAGDHYICHTARGNVLASTLFDRNYPEAMAFRFLSELLDEFVRAHGPDVEFATETHAFMQFDAVINRLRKSYSDTRTQNLQRVTSDLSEVHDVMSQNINDILLRGEKISTVAQKSEDLLAGTARYAKAAKDLNSVSWMQKAGAIGVVAFMVLVWYIRSYWTS